MIWQRMALLTGALATTLTLAARADDAPKSAPAQQMCTVRVCEWVPETYQCTRTVYKTECRQETYTAYKTECVPETRTRTVTVNKMVPEVKEVTRTYCVRVPVTETKTVMESHWTCKPVTKMVTKCVDKGHWECQEVPCGPSFRDRLSGLFHRHGCGDSCGSNCGDACNTACCEPCPKTKTKKVWVSCKVNVECPVTCYERVCEQRPVTKCCTTYKTETRTEVCKVNVCKCVPECKTETYTCMVKKCVPCQATRTVKVCVPCTETFTATRCVQKWTEKQVPVTPCCENACDSCGDACCRSHHRHHCGHRSCCQ